MELTAEVLNHLTDSALFEKIANSYLRVKYPKLKSLIESGLNYKGETVKDPLDGFCIISDLEYALIQHTINDSNSERKWLHDSANSSKKNKTQDGDLVKARKKADLIRSQIPNAHFTVYLTTNHDVKTSLALQLVNYGNIHSISVEIIDLKTIANFLDFDPDGQYLRYKYLNIDTELLTISFLKELQFVSLKQYEIEQFIEVNTVEPIFDCQTLIDDFQKYDDKLFFIIAESGLGKTSLCYLLMLKYIFSNSICLRLNINNVENSINVINAIEIHLKELHPKLYFDEKSKELLNSCRLTVIIDDISKALNLFMTLEKIASWSRDSESNIRIICPLKPQHYLLLSQEVKNKSSYKTFALRKPSFENVTQIAKKWLEFYGMQLSELELKDLIVNVDYDPFLLNLALHLRKNSSINIIDVGDTVIEGFIHDKFRQTGVCRRFPIVKITSLIENFGTCLIKNRKLNPSYSELLNWLKENPILQEVIDELSSNATLLRFDEKGILQFSHDRIRLCFITYGLNYVFENIKEYSDIIIDPYYFNILGSVLANGNFNFDIVKFIIHQSPEIVFNALKYLPKETHSGKRAEYLNLLVEWKTQLNIDDFPYYRLAYIVKTISEFNQDELFLFIDKFPIDIQFIENRIRKGDISYTFCYFEELWNNPQFSIINIENLMDHIYLNHKETSIQSILESDFKRPLLRKELFSSCMVMGYLRDSKFIEILLFNWFRYKKNEYSVLFLWSITHCMDIEHIDSIELFLNEFSYITNANNEEVVKEIYGYSWKLSSNQIDILIKLFNINPIIIKEIIINADNPFSLNLKIERNFIEFGQDVGRNPNCFWLPELNLYKTNRQSDSKLFLKNYWSNTENEIGLRKEAFYLWLECSTPQEIIDLEPIIDIHDQLYVLFLTIKIYNADISIITNYLNQLQENPALIELAYHIWNEDIKMEYKKLFNSAIAKFPKLNSPIFYSLVGILDKIPVIDADGILIEFWETIKQVENGVIIALFINSDVSLKLADETIRRTKNPCEFFNSIDQFYTSNKSISLMKLKSLEPYLMYMDEYNLRGFARGYGRLPSTCEWIKSRIIPLLNLDIFEKVEILPTEEVLVDILRTKPPEKNIIDLYLWWKALFISPSLIISALKSYLNFITQTKQFEDVLDILRIIGSRDDLKCIMEFYHTQIKEPILIYKIQEITYEINSRSIP